MNKDGGAAPEPPPGGEAPPGPRPSQKAKREAKLAAALRENLKRRKAQARERQDETKPR
ncbi:hypothetical protein C8P66_112108 [Humitalea rosea]|uniref:Uncharacterized protein n=1 Tax=Humitalea rosea TaxID=990373 RepID=A0A2W7J0F2_9PROT|nr:hypothetical protein [Humitalea rosea]PZW45091.1 hypothetical protein C8P66_112108 [Humitalea rosea]